MSEVKKKDLMMVPYENLVIEPGFNIRQDMGDIPGLAAQIKENGQKVALRGYKRKGEEKYVITDGHRRYMAIGLLLAETEGTYYVSFSLEPQKYNDEQRVIDMFVMNDGKHLTPLEWAEGVRRLQNWGYSDKDIATKIGRSVAYVGKLASLNAAPKKLLNLIQNGTVAASLAMDILSKGETDKFLEDVDAGVYQPAAPHQAEILPTITPRVKITKSDVRPANSWKTFRNFAKNADDKRMEPTKAELFTFLCRMMNDELTEEQIQGFFK